MKDIEKQIMQRIKFYKRYNMILFSITNIDDLISLFNNDILSLQSINVDTYYCNEKGLYEFNQMDLKIFVNDKLKDKEDIKNIIYKNNLCKEYLTVFDNCNYIIKPNDKEHFIESLKKYVEYISNDLDTIKYIKSQFGEFDKNNIYFEISNIEIM